MSAAFFNSTALSGPELHKAIAAARNQNECVMAIFRRHSHLSLGPSQVYALGIGEGLRWLQSSVRRSITTLTDDGYLEKLDVKRMGPHKALEFTWRLKQPLPDNPQATDAQPISGSFCNLTVIPFP